MDAHVDRARSVRRGEGERSASEILTLELAW